MSFLYNLSKRLIALVILVTTLLLSGKWRLLLGECDYIQKVVQNLLCVLDRIFFVCKICLCHCCTLYVSDVKIMSFLSTFFFCMTWNALCV